MPRLKFWSLHFADVNNYNAPEQLECVLAGEIYNDPKFGNGTCVVTSPVKGFSREHRTVTTRSGTVYELGEVDPLYLRWLASIGKNYSFDDILDILDSQ